MQLIWGFQFLGLILWAKKFFMVLKKEQIAFYFILLWFAFLSCVVRAQQRTRDRMLNLDISISGDGNNHDSTKTNYFSLGLLCDKYCLNGLQIEALWSADRISSSGAMISGLVGVSHRMKGVQISGLNSVVVQQMSGVQLSSILNVAGESMNGLQLAAIGNLTPRLHGFQFAGVNNIVSEELQGVQFCSVINVAVRARRSLQFSSLVNVCQSSFSGVQIAATNFTDSLKGLQVGLLNVCARHSGGWQIGLLNWSHNTSMRTIGLVNLDPSTRIQMMFYGGNTSKINTAVRFRNQNIYTIVGFGTHYLGMNDKFSGSLFYRKGLLFPVFHKFEMGGDVGYYHIENFQNNDAEIPERMYSLQARIHLEYRLQQKLGLFLSGGYSWTRYYDKNKFYERKPLVEAGIVVF